MAHPRYEEDFYAWTQSTADLLRNKHYNQVDFDHVIEEIESMGISNENQLISRLAQLILHLLKWEHQKHLRSRSWDCSIKEQRRRIKRLIKQNPSLKAKIPSASEEGYGDAILLFGKETSLDPNDLPKESPYSTEDLLRDDFYPK